MEQSGDERSLWQVLSGFQEKSQNTHTQNTYSRGSSDSKRLFWKRRKISGRITGFVQFCISSVNVEKSKKARAYSRGVYNGVLYNDERL